MKKFMTFILILVVVITSTCSVWAAGEDIAGNRYAVELALMREMGIISGYPDGSMRPTSNVTRAEFVQMLIRILGYDEIVNSASVDFRDVSENYWAFDCIAVAHELGIVNGSGNGMFYPEKNIGLNEAVKMVVCSIGYDLHAQKKGGWSMGYFLTASDLGILDEIDISLTDVVTRDVCARILYNMLDVNIMEESVNGEFSRGDKLFNMRAKIMDWEKGEGLLTGTYNTVIFDDRELEEDEVIIDGKIYKVAATDAEEYFGMYTEFYSYKDENGDSRLLTIYPKEHKNTVISVESERVVDFSRYELKYYEDDSKYSNTEKAEFSSGLKLIVNGQWINGYTDADFYIDEGYLTLIDNDNDNLTDILIINRSQSFLVERISSGKDLVYFKNATLNGKKSIRYDAEDEELRMQVIKDRVEIPFSEIREGDVVTVFMSPDRKNYKILVSERVIDGQLSAKDEENSIVSVNGEEFPVTESFKLQMFGGVQSGKDIQPLEFSKMYKFYIDDSGRIAYVDEAESESDEGFAYIMKHALGKGLSPGIELKVLIGNRTREIEDEKNKDNDKTITEAQNKSIEYLKSEDTLKINGKKCTAQEAADKINSENIRIISFKLNSEGLLTEIESVEEFASSGDRVFNKDIMSFGKTTAQAFIIDKYTDVILFAGSEEDDDYFVSKQIKDGETYRVSGFGRRTYNGYEVDVMVLHDATMSSVITDIDADTPASIIEKVRYALNDDGEYVCKISCYTDGKYEEKEVKETVKTVSKLDSLKTGTVIKYTEDSYDRIHNIEIVQELSGAIDSFHINEHGTNEKILAPCMSIETNLLSNVLNNMIDEIGLSVSGDYVTEKLFNVPVYDGPAYYLYNTSDKTVKVANGEYVRSAFECGVEDADRVFIHSYEDDVRIVVIIK